MLCGSRYQNAPRLHVPAPTIENDRPQLSSSGFREYACFANVTSGVVNHNHPGLSPSWKVSLFGKSMVISPDTAWLTLSREALLHLLHYELLAVRTTCSALPLSQVSIPAFLTIFIRHAAQSPFRSGSKHWVWRVQISHVLSPYRALGRPSFLTVLV